MTAQDTAGGFGVYVHWPFCLAKCPYCDFNSHVRQAPPDQARYVAAFRREIAHMRALTGPRTAGSVFFGGGTPSLMAPETVGAILDAIREAWTLAPDAEITLEANPTSVEAGRFRGYRAAGVNRVSLGVQALDDGELKKLGRMHTVDEALGAVGIARSIFERVSFDLIYARPGQNPQDWARELSRAIDEGCEHLSLYQLTIEPGTAFEKLYSAGKLLIPDDEHARALWDVTQEVTAASGLPAYEISNHARPGAEARHNLVYWRYGLYAGVGPGAHGRVGQKGERRATYTERHPEGWLKAVEANGHGIVSEEVLTAAEQADEMLLMGLRLAEGVDLARHAALGGTPIDPARIAMLADEGLVRLDGTRLKVLPPGFPVLNAVIGTLAG
ncbi:putative oxygen-independent coproporphyrinogen III oxidase [Azorhizobium caulinodans ORS 571]|uniref:Heme chaperone HemW n=1 Tax=Azorhizobium caulinodans (strain ATCC 43989 / DSM 5975 / JCM 20966 / LMG 6465 / NBRC 14845 / NCIMB 13405 / ORS 571) TaxID=438753 RepID=A8HV99_AZOC5|nr:radical SAM family heme chaperone HemW [Azorhizobium caulinodans]BAF90289.1 putative oxygen-independent coproporphyrinogen III oxidase [Azorhizobium caulinodans ORS 571]